MNKLILTLCCLWLASSSFVLAQSQGPASPKKPPVTAKEAAEKKKQLHTTMGQCSSKAGGNTMKPGTPEFDRYMANCMK